QSPRPFPMPCSQRVTAGIADLRHHVEGLARLAFEPGDRCFQQTPLDLQLEPGIGAAQQRLHSLGGLACLGSHTGIDEDVPGLEEGAGDVPGVVIPCDVPVDLGARTRSEEQRLNSSHVKISYAVFCLKKKNEKNNNDPTTLVR